MVPKGKLLIIGGAEERSGSNRSEIPNKNNQYEHFEILKQLLPRDRMDERIEVITTASRKPEEMERIYKQTLKEIGYTNFGFLKIADKIQARENEVCRRVAEAHAVFFTGGDQLRLATIIAGTELADKIRENYFKKKGFVVAGTSAGAMAMSSIMISGGGVNEALLGLDIHTASGFGFLENCIIDTHFVKRGRFSRLAHAVIINPENIGIGLAENAALVISEGKHAECIGSGMVVVIDGSAIQKTNISEVDAGRPVYVENLKVHLLIQHCTLNLETCQIQPPRRKPAPAN